MIDFISSESRLVSEFEEWVVSSSSNDTDSVIEVGCCSDIDELGERVGCSYTNSTDDARSEELENTSDVIKTELIFLFALKHLWAGLAGKDVGLNFLGEDVKSNPLLCDGALSILGSGTDDDRIDFVFKSDKFVLTDILELSFIGILDGEVGSFFLVSDTTRSRW